MGQSHLNLGTLAIIVLWEAEGKNLPATMKIVRCAGLKDLLARLMPLSVFFSTRGTRGGS